MDFSNLVTREIDDKFCYIQYDDFEVIMMKENNYINATKLCKLGGKNLKHWLENKQSKELIRELQRINGTWKHKSPSRNSGQVILEIGTISKGEHQYEVAGSYVHPDLVPHIASWVSALFAIKVSKVINYYISGKYEFKLKEQKDKIDDLMDLLIKFDEKYDRDTAELRERYREQRKEAKELKSHLLEIKERNKELEKKYDRDTVELKEQNKELSKGMKRMEEKYDRDTQELKSSLTEFKEHNKELKEQNKSLERKVERIEERLKDKVINPSSPNKFRYADRFAFGEELHRLVILQKKNYPKVFRTLRVQSERINQELNKIKNDYRVFFNAYEPKAVSCFNNLKERSP